ncbi:MAG: glycoside hydrolase family 3 N-terminal domain-containing protein [Anaerolineales bacterium]
MMAHWRWLNLLVLAAVLTAAFAPAAVLAQQPDPARDAAQLLARLSPEERVGQLFLVSFNGASAAPDTKIYDLITRYHVGGVVLRPENDNFTDAPNTLPDLSALISALQQAEYDASTSAALPEETLTGRNYIPLFVGVAQEGGGATFDAILSGLTPLPNQMAIGATWQPDLARRAGEVMGRELTALGFNLYLGLSLDVLSAPNPARGADLGPRVFGGDPYWVAELGRAYVEGLHTGSNNSMAVVARHFPGRGESDRPPDEEVSTVRKSLEQLKQIELPPFFAVTGQALTPETSVDALLVSHIRYQGFQGNIRATTRPVSFDPLALAQILALPEFSGWRQRGGVMVSDDLGSLAVRRFYDPDNTAFQVRLVARDAFLAGNDLIMMGNVVSSDALDNYETVVRALEFFTQKYREDPAFAQRVDESVLRLLTLKFRLYDNFTLQNVLPTAEALNAVGQSGALTFEVAQRAATLISPSSAEIDAVLPDQPAYGERLVFITDVRLVRQCNACAVRSILEKEALQAAVLRLYGPGGGGQVAASLVSSYSFDDMARFLNKTAEDNSFETAVRRAQWVIISTLDLPPNRPESVVLRRFLSEQQSLLRNKRIVLFSFSAPYYLDATDISRLTAYYAMYSSQPQFVDVAARLLFREITPLGALPVSVSAIGYDLISALAPNPDQVIELFLDGPFPPIPTETVTGTPVPTPAPLFKVGDSISVRTGQVRDKNGHPVPDGTVVRFILSIEGEGIVQFVEATTSAGVARAAFRLERPGVVEIRATSEPAVTSVAIRLDITGEAAAVTVVPPTAMPTPTEPPPVLVEATPQPVSPFVADGRPLFAGWLVAMLVILFGAVLAFGLGSRYRSLRWGVRFMLAVIVGGLLGYNYHALGLGNSAAWIQASGYNAVLELVAAGSVAGLLAAFVWERISAAKRGDQTK